MDDAKKISRRAILAAGALAGLGILRPAGAQGLPPVTVNKDPDCGCCAGWADHLRAAGFPVTIIETKALRAVRQRLGVPDDLASCHTAEVAGYVIEGHVPAPAILRLIAERPQGRGLAVPGMPIGSPGMEGGEAETYEVLLFGAGPARLFGRYKGADAV